MFYNPLPAWSEQFNKQNLRQLSAIPPFDTVTREWAWGGATGKGINVAVIDSGIDASHEIIQGNISGYVNIHKRGEDIEYDFSAHDDAYGHGTACAGIIRSIAPECNIYSVKVLGSDLKGQGLVFAAGLKWVVEHDMHVCNLSLGTTKQEFFGILHELADRAYFKNQILVTSANNLPIPSFPSVYASVISVAAHAGKDPFQYFYNPEPPVDFGAPGINIRVPWSNRKWSVVTGNSFAAPNISGIVALILSKHPQLTPFQMKAILYALAANVNTQEKPRRSWWDIFAGLPDCKPGRFQST